MNEEDRMDLSPLEPTPAHWRSVMEATMARVDGVLLRRPQDPLSLIAAWSRPLLVAAAVALLLLVPFEVVLEMREARAEQVQRLVALSSEWDHGEPPPSAADFLRALAEERTP
jgi:hypothetical protein